MTVYANKPFPEPADVFQRHLIHSLSGSLVTSAVMLILGHEPAPHLLESVLRDVFVDPARKRDYSSDFVCIRCGQRFESKWKSLDKFLMIGPDQLTHYVAEDAIIVFTLPSRIIAVSAKAMDVLRHLSRPGYNQYGEPFLDFSGVKLPLLLEMPRGSQCDRPATIVIQSNKDVTFCRGGFPG